MIFNSKFIPYFFLCLIFVSIFFYLVIYSVFKIKFILKLKNRKDKIVSITKGLIVIFCITILELILFYIGTTLKDPFYFKVMCFYNMARIELAFIEKDSRKSNMEIDEKILRYLLESKLSKEGEKLRHPVIYSCTHHQTLPVYEVQLNRQGLQNLLQQQSYLYRQVYLFV